MNNINFNCNGLKLRMMLCTLSMVKLDWLTDDKINMELNKKHFDIAKSGFFL